MPAGNDATSRGERSVTNRPQVESRWALDPADAGARIPR